MDILNIIQVPYFKKGNGIHIKKKNRGKFTEYCNGKVTQECIDKAKKSNNPTLRKRATFADNARKWKHQKGGSLVPKHQNPAGGITLIGKDRSPGITGWMKEWWNDYPKDYSDGMCATDSNGNPISDCSKYSNKVLQQQGFDSIGDAWLRVPYSGAEVIYSGYDNKIPDEYSDTTYWDYMNAAANRAAQFIDLNQLQDYDIVGLTSAGSPSTQKAYNAGKKHGRINTHTGHIRIGKDGTRYVVHNVHNNLYQHKAADLLGGNKTFSIVEVARPKKKKK